LIKIVGPCLHGYPYRFQVPKPLVYAERVGSETTPVDNFTIFVECAVMVPDIPKIDPDRRTDPGASAWYFRDELLRMLFICIVSLLQKDLLISLFGGQY
jgi:hypothetical protein